MDRQFEYALVDLDDCLYSNEEIRTTVRSLIERYMVQNLGIPEAEVESLCTELFAAHGTTYAGLVARGYQIDPDHWHAHVHAPLEYGRLLGPDPVTRSILQSMTVPRFILTNADAQHAQKCLEQMGLADCFQGVFCYENLQELAQKARTITPQMPVVCKPQRTVFELVLQCIGAEASKTVFLDDSLRNVAAAHALGITSVLVGREGPVAGAHHAISSFHQLPAALPDLFAGGRQHVEQYEMPEAAGVPVTVRAS